MGARRSGDGGRGEASGIHSVTTAVRLLECLRRNDELSVSELARRLGVAKSTAHRLAATLVGCGFLTQDETTRRYSLGPSLAELGQLAADRMPLRRAALPVLEQLRQRTDCTAHLALVDDLDVVYIERLVASSCNPLFSHVPRRFPLHVTSSGTAISAFAPELAERRVSAGLVRFTAATVRDEEVFRRRLELTRQRGYACTVEGAAQGVASVAVPVLDGSGRPVAALSVAGPVKRVLSDTDSLGRLVGSAVQWLKRAT